MKKNLIIRSFLTSVVMVSATAAMPAFAFGGLGDLLNKNAGSPTASTDISVDIANFVGQSNDLQALGYHAMQRVNAAFAKDGELANKRAEREALEKITDPKERNARLAQGVKTESAEMEANLNAADLEERMKSLSKEKKQGITEAMFNLGIAALRAPTLAATGQSIMQSVGANPLNLMKIAPVKDALPSLAKFAQFSGGAMVGFVKVMKGADVSVKTASADSKPVSLTW